MKFDNNPLYFIESTLLGNRYSLFTLASWKNGLPFKKIDFSEKGKPIIKIAELNNGISNSTSYTDKEYSSDVYLKKGDFVFSWSGNPDTSIDIFRYNLPDGWLNQHIFKVVPEKGLINKEYFFYVMKYLKPQFRAIATNKQTTGLGHVTIADLQRISVVLPCFEIQLKIASILKTLDDKIELNQKINDNLERQAQALYKAWFVDFEPFGGVKPAQWQLSDIYSVANIIYGAPFSSKLFNTEGRGKPIIRIRDLKEQAFVTYTTEVHPKGRLLKPGDIVVGMDGEFRPYVWGNTEAWLNQRVCIFESKNINDKAFVLFAIKPLLNVIEQTQVATTVIHIGKKDYDAFEILLPDRKTLDDFGAITAPMINQIVNNCLENKRLSTLRDALLPRLMSGELDVSNLEI